MLSVRDFELVEKLYESARTLIYRARRAADQTSVILKILKEDYPKPEAVARYKNEYEITSRIDKAHVIHSSEWRFAGKKPMIVLEDFGARSLRQLMAERSLEQKWSLVEVLKTAILIAKGIDEIHSSGVIHKDINPSNIVLNPETQQLKIIDFGVSTVLHHEAPSISNPEILEGTLAYISPEQTGRMNRVLDYRSDFYSFGVTLYELFTGALPIVGSDPLDVIYRHLTQRPLPAYELEPGIPIMISNIIAKLLEKTAEERYQSGWGIVTDLEECLRQLQTQGKIDPFSLGRQDVPAYFHPSQKLYGRGHEIEEFTQAFDRVSRGAREFVLVAGYSGIGKTRLVQEVFKPLTRRRGYFIGGKFDQVQRGIPYSALTKAFQELTRQLLVESEGRLQYWRTKMMAAVGQNGQIIADVIPEIELIIGRQQPVPQLSAIESQNRFHLVFKKFIRVFYQPEHPLVVFLDDLQWTDLATLKLIEMLMTEEETGYLFLVGAYRDNEVGEDHPLLAMLDRLKKQAVQTHRIVLAPLELEQINEFIADTLYCSLQEARSLAELVQSKTGGNPFFIGQFLQALYREGLIRFEAALANGRPQWQWDIRRIRQANITDNVVDLMIKKLGKLPSTTIQVLRLAACLGNQFDLNVLAAICKMPESETYGHLFPAMQEGIVLPISELALLDEKDAHAPLVFAHFKFLHDRVQQAAYAMIEEGLKPQLHLDIGRLLWAQTLMGGPSDPAPTSHQAPTEVILKVVDHLNRGRGLIKRTDEKMQLARLDLEAAKRVKSAGAYEAALHYLKEGMTVFESDWKSQYDLTFALSSERAEVEYLNGNYQSSENVIAQIWSQSDRDLDKADVYTKLIIQRTMLGLYNEAIEAANQALHLLGMGFPTEDDMQARLEADVSEIDHLLQGRTVASLIDLPQMKDPRIIVVMRILNVVHAPIYFTANFRFYSWALSRMTLLSLQYGNIPESAKGYASFGNTLGVNQGKYQMGYEFGLLGLKIAEKYNHQSLKCKACFSLTAFLNHWVRPITDAEFFNEEGQRAGIESGELQYVGYILSFGQAINRFHQGENLELLLEEVKRNLAFTRKVKHKLSTDILEGTRLVISQLTGRTMGFSPFSIGDLSEKNYLANCLENRSFTALCFYNVQKAFTLYLMGDSAGALTCAEDASRLLGYVKGVMSEADLCFYQSLILAELWPRTGEDERPHRLRQIYENQERMRNWAAHCPENFQHKHLLVEAELARILGRPEKALELYDRSIAAAMEQGFIQNEALANELAGKFWMDQGKEEFALLYLKRAWLGYRSWGARLKEAALVIQYPQIKKAELETGPAEYGLWTEKISSANLELASVIKASQAISSEIVFDRLLDRLMKAVIENAGAENGSLILWQDEHFVAAASITSDNATIFPNVPIEASTDLPQQVIQYAIRTRDIVVGDFTIDAKFSADSYLIANQPKSILCLPILQRNDLIGVLYLENRNVVGAFSPVRVEVLKILSAQAAISLQNSFLLSAEQAARRASEEAQRRTAFLAELSRLLAESLEYTDVLTRLSHLVVQTLADWCMIDMIEDGQFQRLSVAHVDPSKQRILEEVQIRYPPRGSSHHPAAIVVRTGQHVLVPNVSDEALRNYCEDERHVELMRQVGANSFLGVPLISRGRIIGVLSMGSGPLRRQYGTGDLELVNDAANRAAAAIENALLYKKVQHAVKMRDDFIMVASHELRTPAAAILLQTQMIKRFLENAPDTIPHQETLLAIVNKSLRQVDNLIRLFETMLEASRMGAGQLLLERQSMNLSQLVRETVARFGSSFREANCDVKLHIEGEAVGQWDRLRLEQVVANLISNAIKYGSGKSVEISILTESKKALLVIRDHGIGISLDEQKKIFQRFERSSLIRHYAGLGLGLYITREIVLAHGGSIRVKSEKGQGSTFTVELPFKQPLETHPTLDI